MAHISDLIATDIDEYLKQHEAKSLLRFITCGSVDDGKSTLIGRMLYEAKMLFEDQLAAIEADSVKWGTQGAEIDFALLVDGLAAEREQGITIDVAYRYFSTDRRKFIVADTPGHEQYTRNMVTGASTADVAVVLVDARRGVLTQTRRHSFLVSLIGIRNVVLAINKMDLMGYSQEVFDAIVADYREFAKHLSLDEITAIPLSALRGDNMLLHSAHTPWYDGPTLMGYLETVDVSDVRLSAAAFRLPVQWVNRPNLDFRGFSGTIASGAVKPGDRIRVQPSGRESSVARIVTADGDLARAVAGQSITLTLADEIDVSRGAVLSHSAAPAEEADRFEATLVWMAEEALAPGRGYLLKIGTQTVPATVGKPKHKVDVNTMEQLAASTLALNEIGVCEIALDRVIAFDPYAVNRETGGFILIDRLSNGTVGAGMLHVALHAEQSRAPGHRPCVLWLTGSADVGLLQAIAEQLEARLLALGLASSTLSDDRLRLGLNKDLGDSDADRTERARRVGEVARLLVDAGLSVIVALGADGPSGLAVVRSLVPDGEFIEVPIDAVDRAPEQQVESVLALLRARGLLA
jgi:bifunctional enzyme CysN/CysC